MHSTFAFRSLFGMIAAVLIAGCGGGSGGPTSVVIRPTAIADGTTGVAYSGFLSASGGSGSFTWTETGGLPPGLSFSTAGQLSGTPVTAGSYPFTVTVTDSSNPPLTDSITASIKIDDSAIVISTSPAPPAGALTLPYPGFAFAATGGSPPFTWSIKSGTLPAGLILGPDGSISGTVTANAVSSTFTVAATDSAQTPQSSAPQSFTVAITSPGTPVITPIPGPPAGVSGTVYPGFNFTATGGFAPLTWKLMAGSGPLPRGLTLGTDGSLTGTPTLAGTFPFTVTVTDSAPMPVSVSLAFSVTITNPPPPTINPLPPPTATVGAPYSFQFTASDGLAPLVWSETGALPGLSLTLGGLLSGTPTGAGIFPITVNVIDQLKQSATPTPFTVRVSLARPDATFTSTLGRMTIARSGHTSTLLLNGKVLMAGGPDASAELYDPNSEMFTATGSMTVVRSLHTATLLANSALPNHGKVLVTAGGSQTAELYDPTVGTFTATASLVVSRVGPTATLLQNGQVLIAGGATASAEIFNPTTGTFSATGSMTVSRSGHTASLLTNGQVLITGGGTATAELYDPASGLFTGTGPMSEVRSGHTATLLADGSVLIVGPDSTAELYTLSGSSGTFASVGNRITATSSFTATLRSDGTVVIAGGRTLFTCGRSCGRFLVSRANAELFAPESESFIPTGSLITARDGHAATLLGDGTVLVTGGVEHSAVCTLRGCRASSTVLSSAELFK